MHTRFLGVVGVLAVALASLGCAAGGEPVQEDGGTAGLDAAADASPPAPDGPAQVDAPAPPDGPATGDAPAQVDGVAQQDGGPQQDGTPQQDGACNVQNTGACDVVCQNCSGQKCAIDSTNHQVASCVANGTMGPGVACTSDASGDNCQAGLICLSDGKCRSFCRGDGDCLASNGACIVGITWGGSTPFKACKVPDACDPVENTGCTSPAGCFLWANDAQTFCLTAGSGSDAVPCPNGNECLGGFVCVAASGTTDYRCRKICRFSPASTCPTGTCQHLGGLTNYGFCGG